MLGAFLSLCALHGSLPLSEAQYVQWANHASLKHCLVAHCTGYGLPFRQDL